MIATILFGTCMFFLTFFLWLLIVKVWNYLYRKIKKETIDKIEVVVNNESDDLTYGSENMVSDKI